MRKENAVVSDFLISIHFLAARLHSFIMEVFGIDAHLCAVILQSLKRLRFKCDERRTLKRCGFHKTRSKNIFFSSLAFVHVWLFLEKFCSKTKTYLATGNCRGNVCRLSEMSFLSRNNCYYSWACGPSFLFTAACRRGWWVSTMESDPLASFLCQNHW